MDHQEKRRMQTRNFILFYMILYIAVSYFTIHLLYVIKLSGEKVRIENIEKFVESAIVSIQKRIFVQPSQEMLKILFVEFIALSIFVLYKITTQKNLMRGKEHGTARWGNHAERSRIRHKDKSQNVILTATEVLSLDTRKTNKNLNILAIGGSGTGKSRSFVKPNLLQANTSYVVTDPKGELLRDTGYFLQSQGYRIKVLNLIDLSNSYRYNPFAYIKKESDILKVINNLIQNTNPNKTNNGDPFWEKAEIALFQAIFFYIFYELHSSEHQFKTVFSILRLAEVKEDDEDFISEFDMLFEMLRKKKPDHIAVKQYDVYKMASGKTAKGILISAGVRLSPFGIDEVEQLFSTDELELHKLGDEKTALFVIISDSDTTFNFIASMMYAQLFDSLYYHADFVSKGTLKYHVKFWLDEFANIGRIPDFDKLIATMRSRNISVSVILQNLSQLKNLYKDNWETIVGNCDTILFLGGQERSTLEWVNKGLGKMTIDTQNSGRSKGRSGSSSINYSTQGRELMTLDEIAEMPDRKCIVFVRGIRPFYSDKFKLQSHKHYKFSYDANEFQCFVPEHGARITQTDLQLARFNIRVPDSDMDERKSEIEVVDMSKIEEISKKMDELM
ncbi:type IV secretory system conjugative DNA transfer family protein [Paenibacillus sp. KQZ6P-2]|uniref:Type IV secretory system conjugative DNA transfer family protein n=1 Tax=Paenibacillus mangrovi TaxID=2931978 RepID=A0A9X2B3M5_9BACL|nr:type IV secretory system conjugative DNA transfer family protein [Paenibacillus mangrovi]MCJ8010143.1 type IV secretory system conjugative DNA transfer family protein [Paenibacillus mangrovi]